MPYKKKSWTERLCDSKDLPKVVTIGTKMQKRWNTQAGDTCAIPAPLDVDALMKQIPKGKLITINELRTAIARQHHATIGCPITTGIFAWIAAHAAEESAAASKSKSPRITPYWRTLKTNGELNPKYPGGIPALTRKLKAEGHKITRRGRRVFVAGFEKAIASL
jgi:hypothetical protein